MKTRHEPSELRRFYKKANTDINLELKSKALDGQYVDAVNFRPTGVDGDKGGAEKIKGEELLYPADDTSCNDIYGGGALPNGFECMAAMEVNDHIVEIWANVNQAIDPFVRIDGIIVASHPDLPFRLDYPIQFDKNESCVGGEFFTTDHRTPPIILNVKDMLLNGGVDVGDEEGECTEKYFTEFQVARYTVNLTTQLDQMRFIDIDQGGTGSYDEVYGSAGLVGGSYQYTYRYVTSDGDRTNLAPLTPTIPVPRVVSAATTAYPYNRTFGTDVAEATTNGIHLRFRITNTLNYDYVEIIRIPYNNGEALDFAPDAEIIGVFDIPDGVELMVVNILDFGPEATEPLTENEQSNLMAAVQAAKSIRYFNRRLHLFNIIYASRDTENSVTFKAGSKMFPVTAHLGKAGHADPWNTTYRRTRQHDEYYGNGLVLWDAFGNYTFAQDIPGFENHRMPQNRLAMPQESKDNSLGVVPTPMMDMTGTLNSCFEFWDLHDARRKDNGCQIKSIIGTEFGVDPPDPFIQQNVRAYTDLSAPPPPTSENEVPGGAGINNMPSYLGCSDITQDEAIYPSPTGGYAADGLPPGICDIYSGLSIPASSWSYNILHPTNEFDANIGLTENDHDYTPTVRVLTGGITCSDFDTAEYGPEGFSPDWFSLGMAFRGLESWPDWAVGFSLVRTKPAGRVVAEGMSFYDLTEADFNAVGADNGIKKEQWSVKCYFSDVENGMSEDDLVANINANPSLYAVQFFSPIGFFTEMYNGTLWCDAAVDRDRNVDICVYPRIHEDHGQINAGEFGMGFSNHVGFGKYRNTNQAAWTQQGGVPGNAENAPGSGLLYEFELDSGAITSGVASDRAGGIHNGTSYYVIQLPLYLNGLYNQSTIGGGLCDKHFDSPNLKNFQEPLYAVRIVRKNRTIDTSQNIREFIDTGHFQKFSSIIGKGDGSPNQSFELVDERWEDCCPDLDGTTIYAGRDAYIYMEDGSSNEYRWLNVTNMAPATISALNAAIDANGSTTHNSVEIYGLFEHTSTPGGRYVNLLFNYQNVPKDTYVVVKYDNTIPIRVFDGEKTVGEEVFCPIDEEVTPNPGDRVGFIFNSGFPYYEMQINPRMLMAKRTFNQTRGLFPLGPVQARNQTVQAQSIIDMDYIRQLIVMYPALTRSHLGLPHERRRTDADVEGRVPREGFFPATHYIMRPGEWLIDGGPASTFYRPNGHERHNWDDYGGDFPGHVYEEYRTDYPGEGAEEIGQGSGLWGYGGFRYEKLINIDYSKVGTFRKYNTRPSVGFEEQTVFCTRILWSLERNINVQDEPGLRTFLATHAFDIDDRQGEIKMGWSALSGSKGENLYAFTDSGTCLVITDKRIISDLNAEELMLVDNGSENYISGQWWISRIIGMHDEMYRSSAERDNALYFINKEGAYMFYNNVVAKIDNEYTYRIRKNFIEQVEPEYRTKLASVFDTKHEEVWFGIGENCIHAVNLDGGVNAIYPEPENGPYDVHIILEGEGRDDIRLPNATQWPDLDRICITNNTDETITVEYPVALVVQEFPIEPGESFCFTREFEITQGAAYIATENTPGCATELLVYAPNHEGWIGRYTYRFDEYLSFYNRTYGFRDGETYELHKGYLIEGAKIRSTVDQVFNPEEDKDKEFTRIRAAVKDNTKPTSIEFVDGLDGTVLCVLDAATFGQFYLKNYHGWEQDVPRKIAAPFDRVQGRQIIVRVVHEEEEPFVLATLRTFYKALK